MIASPPGAGPRILIIEDEAIVAMELEDRLREMGYTVSGTAASYEEALQLAQEHRPDLVLADIRIAGPKDGIDTVRALRERWDMPAVFLTAHSDAETLGRAVESAQFGYLTKPFRERELQATIEMALYRFRVERELADRERQLLEAQRLGQVGSWVWDLEAGTAAWSPELYRILGVSPASLPLNGFEAFLSAVHPDDRGRVRATIQRAMEEPGPADQGFRIVRPGGEVRYIEARAESQRDPAGTPVRMLGVSRDVTETRQAEDETRLLQTMALAVGQAPDMDAALQLALRTVCETTGWAYGEAWVPDMDGSRLRLSPAWFSAYPGGDAFHSQSSEVVFRPGEGLPGRAWQSRTPIVTQDVTRDPAFLRPEAAETAGLGTGLAIPIVAGEAVVAVMAFFLARQRSLDERKVALVTTVAAQVAAIMQRKQADQAFQRLSGELQAIFEALPDLFFHVDRDGRILGYKAGRTEDLFLPPGEFVGRLTDEIMPPDVAATIGEGIRECLLRRSVVAVEYELHLPLGPAQFEARIAPNSRDEAIALVRNVTERRRAEAALREHEERVREASKLESLGRLAGGIAHDFNNLLTVILGYADLIDEDPEFLDEALGEIRRAAQRARDLTQQMLAFARKQTMLLQVVNLNEQILGFERLLRRALGEDVHLRLELSAGLWPLKADPSQIEQMLLNLALNARDAMGAGGTLTLRTANAAWFDPAEAPPGPYVCLEVEDTGAGMPPEILAHIFEPFFTTKGVGKGTGLGLATVYGIVKQGAGQITVESTPGKGTLFRIHFPRAADSAVREHRAASEKPGGGNETILVVEDEPAVLRVTVRALSAAGYTVQTAQSGREAIKIAAGLPHLDLLVSDVMMPELRGPQVAAALRERWPDLPVLFVSGYAPEDTAGPSPADMGRLLPKPFTNAALLAEVRAILDGRSES